MGGGYRVLWRFADSGCFCQFWVRSLCWLSALRRSAAILSPDNNFSIEGAVSETSNATISAQLSALSMVLVVLVLALCLCFLWAWNKKTRATH
jgi:hypothetical protein